MPEITRVVEIRGAKEGSGYLIGPGLILTSWHVLRPPAGAPFPKQVEVRTLRDYQRANAADRLKTRSAELLWPLTDLREDDDFALLRIADSPTDPTLQWADLPDWDEVEVQAVGFPDFGIFSNGSVDSRAPLSERDTVLIRGHVPAVSGWKQRQVYGLGPFDIVLQQEDLPKDSPIRWEGMSGAAVFAGRILVGVVRTAAEGRPGLHRLRALPVARLFTREDVRAVLSDAGLDLPQRCELISSGKQASPSLSRRAPSQIDPPRSFYNKIFFCEIIDHWKFEPFLQYTYQRKLNRVLLKVMAELGEELGEKVLAVPTGDGVVLNFLESAPDVHLRAAIGALATLHDSIPGDHDQFGLRISLNSTIDTLSFDINGNMNVAGSGIDIARRVISLGKHRQILMNDRVRIDLDHYPTYSSRILPRGTLALTSGNPIPISQYVDPDCPFISNALVDLPPAFEKNNINIDDILRNKVNDKLLSITIGYDGRDFIDEVRVHVEDFIDKSGDFQQLKVAIGWIASEMLLNAFEHGCIGSTDSAELRLERTAAGILVKVGQPDNVHFDLNAILRSQRHTTSFMQLMQRRGFRWHEWRKDGRLELGLEIPAKLNFKPMAALTTNHGQWLELPDTVAAFLDEVVDECVCGGVSLIRLRLSGKIDAGNAENARDILISLLDTNDKPDIIIVDLGQIDYIGSVGFRSLMITHREANQRGSAIILSNLQPRLVELFSISRFNMIFKIFDTSENAFRSFSEFHFK